MSGSTIRSTHEATMTTKSIQLGSTLLCLGMSLAACGDDSGPMVGPRPTDDANVITPAVDAGNVEPDAHWEPATDDAGASFGDGGTLAIGGSARSRHRMTIDQLNTSLRRATGLAWMVNGRDGFDVYRATLGVPDYVLATHEDTDVSPLFLKFLSDASRSVCTNVMNDTTARATFFHDAEPTSVDQSEIDANLSYLLLRYHTRRVAPSSRALEPWRALYASARAASSTDTTGRVAWQTVCNALIQHPDFYTY